MANEQARAARAIVREPLTGAQVRGFWAAWCGWTLDGMDSFIFALVLAPALRELLPRSGMSGAPGHVVAAGSVMFAVFLAGWGSSIIWGSISDRWGRARALATAVLCYAVFTGAAAAAGNVYELGLFRFLAGVGIGGEWALAGTYVAEIWPESRRSMGAGYLQTGYYAGFFLAAALNYIVGAHFGWRAMFLCGAAPAIFAIYLYRRLGESPRWQRAAAVQVPVHPLRLIFASAYRRRTLVNTALLTVSILGLWAGSAYEPAAIAALAQHAGRSPAEAARLASFGTGLLSIATALGCLAAPPLAERFGRRPVLAAYFLGMALSIWISFGWAFYLPDGLRVFIASLALLGFFGGNFALYTLWLPEQYPTLMRATAFAFATSFGRFIGAGANFLIGSAIASYGSIGRPIAVTALAFVIGLLLLPWALETRGQELPP